MPEKKRILVLFPDEWDESLAANPQFAGRYTFAYEGFDLFAFPQNAQLFTYNVHRFAERCIAKYRGKIDAVFTSEEQFGPTAASLIGSALGLPHLPLTAILNAQHKYYARVIHRDVAPEATPKFGLVDRERMAKGDIPLPYPFYIKPIKAAFSVLARKIRNADELAAHTRFAWFEDAIIKRLVKPFNDATRDLQQKLYGEHIDAYTMIAEEELEGCQVTLNGYAQHGSVHWLGTVDSVMYPRTDQFMRFQYPSRLPAEVLQRMEVLGTRIVNAIGFTHGMFNMEMMWCPATDRIGIVEINPRVAGQFFDLFEKVDGYSLFDATLALALNEQPVIRERSGHSLCASSFVLRDFSGRGLAYWPSSSELEQLRRDNPDAHIHFYLKRGADLKRELKWLSSYRYCVMNIGGASLEDMFARFVRVRDQIGFHPHSARVHFSQQSIAELLNVEPFPCDARD